jgi:hypothetical protein
MTKNEGTARGSLKSQIMYKLSIKDNWSLLQNWQEVSKFFLVMQTQIAKLLHFAFFF